MQSRIDANDVQESLEQFGTNGRRHEWVGTQMSMSDPEWSLERNATGEMLRARRSTNKVSLLGTVWVQVGGVAETEFASSPLPL